MNFFSGKERDLFFSQLTHCVRVALIPMIGIKVTFGDFNAFAAAPTIVVIATALFSETIF